MLTFLAIAIGSFILVTGSFLFGHDHDVDHDHGDLSHDLGMDAEPTVGFFSIKTLGTLMMGFGAAGAIAMYYGFGYLGSSLIGLFCGLVLAALTYFVLRLFYQQQASSIVATSSAVGGSGTVTTSIEKDGLGEVAMCVDGQYLTYSARSADGEAIPKGHSVRVVQTVGSQLVVEQHGTKAVGV